MSLCACTSTSGYLLAFYANDQASPENFEVCHGYSCRYKVDVALPETLWHQVREIFEKGINAPQERKQIALAVSLLEKEAGNIFWHKKRSAKIGKNQRHLRTTGLH